jgi:hypothetical protein
MDPVVCDSCGARFPIKDLTVNDCLAIQDQHVYQELAEELRMLLKVQDYYKRHPNAKGRIKPHFIRLVDSNDPAVKKRFWDGVPFDEIELPPEVLSKSSVETSEDLQVVKFLRHHHFALAPRIEFVSQHVVRLKGSVRAVSCPRCQAGRPHVPPDHWDDFTLGNAITWYWPDWHSIDADGTLRVKASGYDGDSHWSGEQTITPAESDYEFWRWLVAQKEYHRLVEDSELSAIREVWSGRAKPCT